MDPYAQAYAGVYRGFFLSIFMQREEDHRYVN